MNDNVNWLSVGQDDTEDAFWTICEEYEQTLHEGSSLTPEQWLLAQCSPVLRQHLTDLHTLYKASRPSAAATGVSPAVAVPGYEILGELGRGGMGVVYQALQVRLNRVVALKVLLEGNHAGTETLARFRTEAEAAARLRHPHIVPIHEVGEHDGRPFLILEYVAGGSLKQHLDGTPQSARQAARLVQVLARAVHCAHEHGVIHRDLKPANILLDAEGQPHITDFGLAKMLDAGASPNGPTQTGVVVGTPSYMAPEQAAGEARQIGPAVDVYALGAMLYELLTGRPPFRAATTQETLLQVQQDEPVPPRRLQPRTPRDLETACLKCLQKDPRKRYASAGDLADDLGRFADGQPIQARPTGVWERGVKWARRRPTAAALVVVSFLAVVGLLALGLGSNQALREAAEESARERQHALDQRARATAHFQNALDLLEPLSFEVNQTALTTTPAGERFRDKFTQYARGFYQKLLAEQEDSGRDSRRQLGRARYGLGATHALLKENAEANREYRQAAAIQEQLKDEFPEEMAYQVDLAFTYYNLWEASAVTDAKEAGVWLAKMGPLFETVPLNNQRLAFLALRISRKLWELGKSQEALPWQTRLIDRLQAIHGEAKSGYEGQIASNALATALYSRGLLLLEKNQFGPAYHDFDRALRFEGAGLSPAMTKDCQNWRNFCKQFK